jgi:hypothetical protein
MWTSAEPARDNSVPWLAHALRLFLCLQPSYDFFCAFAIDTLADEEAIPIPKTVAPWERQAALVPDQER